MVEISKIVEQNPWWKGKEFEFEKYDEHLASYENSLFKTKRDFFISKVNNIYSISGPRQVGKTTWAKLFIKHFIRTKKIDPSTICYFSCDALLSRSRKELRKIIYYFLERLARFGRGYIFLDEIGFIRDWAFEIKSFADKGNLNKTILFLTGSPLSIKEVEFLPGRHVEGNRYFLKPLTFREFIKSLDATAINCLTSDQKIRSGIKLLKKKLEKNFLTLEETFETMKERFEILLPFKDILDFLLGCYMRTGGFPRPIEDYIKNKKIERRNYETIVNIIMSDLSKRGRSEDTAKQIFSGIIKRLSSSYDFRTLVKDTVEGINVNTIIDYLKIFNDSFLTQILYSYDFERKWSRIKGNKKIYFSDPFLFYSILSWLEGKDGFEITEDISMKEEKISAILESMVFSSLSQTKEIPLIRPNSTFLWFYYDRRGEIDFVFKQNTGKYLGMEVKYQPEVERKLLQLGQIRHYIILSKDTFKIEKETAIVPITLFLALTKKHVFNL